MTVRFPVDWVSGFSGIRTSLDLLQVFHIFTGTVEQIFPVFQLSGQPVDTSIQRRIMLPELVRLVFDGTCRFSGQIFFKVGPELLVLRLLVDVLPPNDSQIC